MSMGIVCILRVLKVIACMLLCVCGVLGVVSLVRGGVFGMRVADGCWGREV